MGDKDKKQKVRSLAGIDYLSEKGRWRRVEEGETCNDMLPRTLEELCRVGVCEQLPEKDDKEKE